MDRDEDEAKQYREKAEQLLVIAQGVCDEKSKDLLLRVALDYLGLATSREALAKSERDRMSDPGDSRHP